MTGRPPTIQGSQAASTDPQSSSSDAGSGGSQFLVLGSLGVVLSAVLSSIAYGMLPVQMRIHWTLGMGPYYGPEFAPTLAVLGGFPLLIAGLALGANWLDALLHRSEDFAAIRPYYVIAMVGTLGLLLMFHAGLIVANL